MVKTGSRQYQEKIKARSRQRQSKVKLRSKQRKDNLNSNNNLMGFDTIEINLVMNVKTKIPSDINMAVVQYIWFENIMSSFLYISYRQVLSYHSDRSSYKLLVHSYSIYTLHTCK